jgi:hypothetical protein
LTKRGQLDETVEVWEVEVRAERCSSPTVGVPFEDELNRLIEPGNSGRGKEVGESLL